MQSSQISNCNDLVCGSVVLLIETMLGDKGAVLDTTIGGCRSKIERLSES